MDIQSIIQDDKKKKFLIIGLVVFLLLLVGLTFILTRSTTPSTSEDAQAQRLADFAKLAPREGTSTSTLELLPRIALSADRTAISPGQSTIISWVATNATECVNIDGDSLSTTGSVSLSPKETYSFDILCTGPKGTDLQSLTIFVTTAPTITLFAYPEAVKTGEQSFISWNAINADRCVDSAGKTLRLSDSFSVSPKTAYTFSMSCTGPKGTAKKSVTVSIAKPLATDTTSGTTGGTGTVGSTGTNVSTGATTDNTTPVVSLSATPSSIEYNKGTTLAWDLKNVTYCVFTSDGAITGLPPFTYASGSRAVSGLTKNQTYTLSCTKGASKIERSVTVSVGTKPIAAGPDVKTPFYADKKTAATFEMIKFSWNISNAKSCSLNKGSEVLKSSLGPNSSTSLYEKSGGTFTYTLVCTGEGGTITSDPVMISFVNCQFTYGFGSTIEEITRTINGKVEPGSRYGRSEPAICTYTYSNPTSIHGLFGWSRELRAGDEKYLCPYTRYYLIKTSSGTQSVNLLDKTYHPNWEHLDKIYYTHPTSCGKDYGLVFWNGNSFVNWGQFGGICGGNVTVVSGLTCLVK
ncbi:MAG: putative-Protein [Parcubacteria group bacterium GW2011_GWA1_44_13]|uniref:Putative-Protein n=1 Tax=Candidatus Nomurabacteria bacterium GW2011_GWB1_44_12 TaxID=1618748 RepID=A0A837I783_9BACT|nr:MAG: putative-Protein [Candidatus Nomurabacteria bacterium GW2011_GWD1_44_10]KKT36930.1 MAG: putative-Protein [Candidatus Nomurabacteria bacterium GW2011_GWB1_44_12]KKT37970.1 MAG: putative-Protein [Parcubacteria group bacterium GW2011_GWA1_44_13]